MNMTRNAATDARKLLAGEIGIALPETVTLAGADAWIGDLPHKRTGPQRVRQKLIAKQWEMKRPVTSGGPRAASVATRIAQPINAIMHHEDAGFPWEDVNDLLLIEGLAFSTVSIDTADWRQVGGLYDYEGKKKVLSMRFAVDAEGRFRGDDGYDEATVDIDAARKELEQEQRDHMARNLPFRQRAYSIRSVAPIWGSDFKLEGLVIETHWTVHRLRARGIYVSKKPDGSDAQLYPLGAIGEGDSGASFGKSVKVIEAWLFDENGPYITMCFDDPDEKFGRFAWREPKSGNMSDSLESHVIDLAKICQDKRNRWRGFDRLPISWGWGLGWSAADMDQRAMGITVPFKQSNLNIDSLLTSIIVAAQWLAFPALIEKVSIADMADQSLDEKERRTPDILPMKITKVTGDITNIGSQGPHPSVFQAISLMMGENKEEQPGGDQGTAPSGYAQTIAEALQSDALTTVNASAMKMASQNGSFIVEGAKILGECYEPIRVYQIADVLIEQKNPSDTDQMLVLDPGLIGSSYQVKAVEKKVPGENPAVRQQNAALVKEGFYDNIWFLEQDGYPSPEEMAMRVAWQKLLDSPEGQVIVGRLLAQYVSNTFVEQIQELIAQGQTNTKGLANGFGEGTSPPPDMLGAGPQATGDMAGMETPNPAAASLAGTVGAAMQTAPVQHSLNGGGRLPETPLRGAVR
jgi:hypothetical protein